MEMSAGFYRFASLRIAQNVIKRLKNDAAAEKRDLREDKLYI